MDKNMDIDDSESKNDPRDFIPKGGKNEQDCTMSYFAIVT